MKRPIQELIETESPAIAQIRELATNSPVPVEILPPSEAREWVLGKLQITTKSLLGAIGYDTGGILVDGGWLRFLGSGHSRLTRTLPGWNEGRSDGCYLIADDVVGGFFALNGGAWGPDLGNVYYNGPDDLNWQTLGISFSDFFARSLTPQFAEFYRPYRWDSWREEVAQLPGDRCFSFYPPLWTVEGSPQTSDRRSIPIQEMYALKEKTQLLFDQL